MKKYSLKNIFFYTAGQLFLIGLLSLSYACKDEPARMTGDVLPDGEMINGLIYEGYMPDTRNTMRESILTSDATYGIIGAFDDPEFGQTKADFLSDFSIGAKVQFFVDVVKVVGNDTIYGKDYEFNKFNNNVDTIADVWKVDSLVLNLQYLFNNWYGDMLSKQNVKIYELTTALGSTSQDYFNDYDVNGKYNPIPLAEKMVHPNCEIPDTLRNAANWADLWRYPDSLLNAPQYLWDNVKVNAAKDSSWLSSDFKGNTSQTKVWSFKLNQDITERFFNFDEGTLRSTAALKGAFSGLYVTADLPSGTDGSLTKINLLSSPNAVATNIMIHLSRKHKYKNKVNEIRDTTSLYAYAFPVNVENVRFNRYKHIPSSSIKKDDPTTDRLYIQGMAGSYASMQLPEEIINWRDSIVPKGNSKEFHLVSNIDLFMEIDTTHYPVRGGMSRYPIPQQLTVKWKNEKGEIVDPIYSIVVNGKSITAPVFGSNADSKGRRSGIGEIVIQKSDEGRPVYLYHFILRADYFNYIMRNQDGGGLDEKEFYIGPTTPTSNFQRVILYSGTNKEHPFKVKMKYFKYRSIR